MTRQWRLLKTTNLSSEAREMLRREYEGMQMKEKEAAALRAIHHGRFETQDNNRSKDGRRNPRPKFKDTCFNCKRPGHKQTECRAPRRYNPQEYVFSATNDKARFWTVALART